MNPTTESLFAALREGLTLGHDPGVEAELDSLCGKKGWTVRRVTGGYEVTAPTEAQWRRLPEILRFMMYGGVSLIQTPSRPQERVCRLLSRADSARGLGVEILFNCAEPAGEDDEDASEALPAQACTPEPIALDPTTQNLQRLLVGAALDRFTFIGRSAGEAEHTLHFVQNPGQGAHAWPVRLSLRCDWRVNGEADAPAPNDTLPLQTAALAALCQTGALTVRQATVRGPDLWLVFEGGETLTTRVNPAAVGEAWVVTKTTWDDGALPWRVASEGGETFVQAVQPVAMPTLRAALTRELHDGAPLDQLYQTLRQWRERGVSQADALGALEAIRAELQTEAEAKDDLVTDLMDFVVGFCSPHMRLY
jgi:hypothetical protein